MLLIVAILFCDVRFHVFVLYTMISRLLVFFFSGIVHSYVIEVISLKKKKTDKFLCDEFLFSYFNLTGPNQYTPILFLNLLT